MSKEAIQLGEPRQHHPSEGFPIWLWAIKKMGDNAEQAPMESSQEAVLYLEAQTFLATHTLELRRPQSYIRDVTKLSKTPDLIITHTTRHRDTKINAEVTPYYFYPGQPVRVGPYRNSRRASQYERDFLRKVLIKAKPTPQATQIAA